MIRVGAASRLINGEIGRPIQGASVNKLAASIRDDCEANAILFADDNTSVLLISCDLVGVSCEFAVSAREAMGQAAGIPPRNIIIAGTHMHSGPSVLPTSYTKPIDDDYLGRLHGWLVELAGEATENTQSARVGWGLGRAQIGYNRRCCWADGTHSLSGNAQRADFTGLEGPDDPAHLALFAMDETGKPIAVLHNNTGHPTNFYGADFYSADFPGEARAYLRQSLGDVPVLFLNGAFGDVGPRSQLASNSVESREDTMRRAGHLLAAETLRLFHEIAFHDEFPLAHVHDDIPVSVRLPDPARVEWARDMLRRYDDGENVSPGDLMFAYGTASLQDAFGDDPADAVPVHAIRIGDVALATQPCELFCQFGLDIKRRSPAALTSVIGIADGYCGYCPTTYGEIGGGYSGEAFHWARLSAQAGCRIVDAASRMLHSLWRVSA